MRISQRLNLGFLGIAMWAAVVGHVSLFQLNQISDPLSRDIPGSLESINEAREDPDEIKKYKKERYRILGKYGIHIGGDQFSIKPENADIVQEEILALKEKYFSALDGEDKRIDGIEELLDKTKEIDIEPINYEWLGDAINSNDVEILMELDLVNRPNDNDDPDRSSGNCNKRLGKK